VSGGPLSSLTLAQDSLIDNAFTLV
jgi:hypothetical protein